jgi:hypothetical protein
MNLYFIFKTQLFTTIYMTGVIWFIQVIHYPLFKLVGNDNWKAYHSRHVQLTTIVIAGPMLIELISLGLLFYLKPIYWNNFSMIISAILILLIWVTTFFISVPIHNQLAIGFNEKSVKILVQTNWIRTISWSLKSIIIINFMNYLQSN